MKTAWPGYAKMEAVTGQDTCARLCHRGKREMCPQPCLRGGGEPRPAGYHPSSCLSPGAPVEVTVSLHLRLAVALLHASLLRVINCLPVPSEEVILLFLAVVPPISCIFMADSRRIELVRDTPLPDVCPASKRRPGPHCLGCATRLPSFLIAPLQEPGPLISFPIFAYSTLLIL